MFQEIDKYAWAPADSDSVSIYSTIDEKSDFTCYCFKWYKRNIRASDTTS